MQSSKLAMLKGYLFYQKSYIHIKGLVVGPRGILGDPGVDSGGVGKSKRGKKIWHEEKQRTARRAPGDNVLQDQFQTVAAVLPSDWAEKHKSFLAPIRSQNGGEKRGE